MASRTALAPAKVNLFLHVGVAKENGRHDLDSLVVFSDDRAGDHVTVEVADTLTLDAAGPFASASGPLPDNLVLRAAEALKAVSGFTGGARITLKKWLPVAAGIGGGSSDAAIVLRLLTELWSLDPALAAGIAPSLGGDVPVVLDGVPAMMRGEGERVMPVRVLTVSARARSARASIARPPRYTWGAPYAATVPRSLPARATGGALRHRRRRKASPRRRVPEGRTGVRA